MSVGEFSGVGQASSGAFAESRLSPRSRSLDVIPRLLPPIATLAVLVTVWSVVASHYTDNVLPGPIATWTALRASLANDSLQPAFVRTLQEAIAGWLIAVCLAIPCGYAIARWRLLDWAVSPYLAALQAVPVIAVAPLLFLLTGFGMEPKIVLAAVISYFPVLATTVSGIQGIGRDLIDVASVFGAKWWQRALRVELPLAARSILAGARIAILLAVVGAYVGELLNSDMGLGEFVNQNIESFSTPTAYVGVVALAVLGGGLYSLLKITEWSILRWTE